MSDPTWLAEDTASRIERYWVGPFEESLIELGSRAHHWDVEETDGGGGLLNSDNVGVTEDGYPTLRDGASYLVINETEACPCCRGSGLRPDGRLRLR